jgi:ATP-dependent DNA helicase RecG
LRVDVTPIQHPDGRVIVFRVPARPVGMPIQYHGAYWMRGGEDLIPMTPDLLKRIFDEAGPDFSAEICPQVKLADLDPAAISHFRAMWQRKSGNKALEAIPVEQLLTDAELVVRDGVTYAALILFGTRQALGQYLGQAEVIFEYRSSDVTGPAAQREEYRQGFFLFQDEIWQKINLRNDKQHFQYGFVMLDVPTFNEAAVREAILNAVSHRDYRLPGSIFVRQYPRRLEVVSPGGFPPGITLENILWRQAPRNRRLAEAFAHCGLVERAGQGMNRIFEECIRESKPQPDFSQSDEYQVALTLHGEIQDPQFLRFLEQVGQERLTSFITQDFLLLDLVRREQPIPDLLRDRLPFLVDQGLIERAGRGRGVRYMLSRDLNAFLGQKGGYTRQRGLDRETNKALLLKHIQDNAQAGSRLQELRQVLPALSRTQVQVLLRELLAEGRTHLVGHTSSARWFPGIVSNKHE